MLPEHDRGPSELLNQENNNEFKNFISGTSSCDLPLSWSGRWFESGERDAVAVKGNNITHKGECVYQKGDKYIFKDE